MCVLACSRFDIPLIPGRIKIRLLLIWIVDNEVVGKEINVLEKKSFELTKAFQQNTFNSGSNKMDGILL